MGGNIRSDDPISISQPIFMTYFSHLELALYASMQLQQFGYVYYDLQAIKQQFPLFKIVVSEKISEGTVVRGILFEDTIYMPSHSVTFNLVGPLISMFNNSRATPQDPSLG